MGNLRLYGSTSGYVEIAPPAVGGSQVLTLPTDSVQPGLVLIANQSVTAASSVAFNNCFNSTYSNYRIVVDSVGSTSSAASMSLQFRTSGTAYSSANYYRWTIYGANSTALAANWVAGTSSAFFTSTADHAGHGAVDVIQPFSSTIKTSWSGAYYSIGSVASDWGWTNGAVLVTNSFDGFALTASSGTFTGSVRIYGYRNS